MTLTQLRMRLRQHDIFMWKMNVRASIQGYIQADIRQSMFFFDLNKRRGSILGWYFSGFCNEILPRLKYIEPLPEKPHYHAAQESTSFNPDWPVRVKVEHILDDEENME